MADPQRLNVGIVGAAGRGGSFRAALEANGARVAAVCDTNRALLPEAAARLGAAEQYDDYERMLDQSQLDAVVIGTPMDCHVPQSVQALQRNLHVLCEVPAAISLEECYQLVHAARQSRGLYMLAENYIYMRPVQLVTHLAQRGLFGRLFYAEGEYLHELKELNEITRWRRHWQTGIAGITYGTHSLGPILQWMKGDRVTRVCCENTGTHYCDPRGAPYAQDSATMLCKTAAGALINIRVDMISDRPHAMTNYELQGTDGVFESSRGGPSERDRLWLRELSREQRWHDLEELLTIDGLAQRYAPPRLLHPPEEALRAGHGGGDYYEVLDFVRAIRGEAPCPIGIHEAMDMTLPGLISQESVLKGGAWLDVPDSRAWTDATPYVQLQMSWPERRLAEPPAARVPAGYELRQFCAADEPQYLELMAKAGFTGWEHERLAATMRSILPDGFFVIEHQASRRLVATALAQHDAIDGHPYGGELGWVAGDPEHRGHGLGRAVCAAATARLIRAGYRDIYLRTDDFRLPAIKIYLQLGYEPVRSPGGMAERWKTISAQLGRTSGA